ncbi:hypothetical protein [Klebsiella michiganensis]|uniref:hypothetical protein n=1 Tax=Klebsiella michiganensis TaxID=1134687 RepID=UPI001BCFD8FB|nr:hypothetical protein [Klebsiella michiganensis]
MRSCVVWGLDGLLVGQTTFGRRFLCRAWGRATLAPGLCGLLLGPRPQQQRAQRGRQGQRHHARQRHRRR